MKLSLIVIIALLQTAVIGWAPEPEAGSFNLPENQWVKIAENPSDPLGRELEPGYGSYFCFLPDSGKFIRYGGYTPTEGNELYTFSVSKREWKNSIAVDYNWPPPSNRPGAGPWWSMAFDAKRKCVWMFGGTGVAGQTHPALYADIWKYEVASGLFTKMNSLNYKLGSEIRIAYDPINDVVVRAPAYAGDWSNIHNRNATWVYKPDSNKWTGRTTNNSPGNNLAAGWLYCPSISKFVYIGFNPADTPQTVLTCTYDAAANKWDTIRTTGKPPARICPAVAYDPNTGLITMYGGIGHRASGYSYLYRGGGVQLEDTWVYDPIAQTWTDITSIVGKPKIADLKKSDGTPLLPMSLSVNGRFALTQGADYDSKNNVFVMSTPTCGVWALRYKSAGSVTLPTLNLPALAALPSVANPARIFPDFPLNSRLVNMQTNKWIKLGGGRPIGGDEIPFKYDANTGFFLKYGGCGNGGTTFASGYGNDLSAYDPFNERWIALRYVDPCGAPRPANGCTRFYAADTANDCVWFTGGTAGNHLAASIPQNWTGTYGTWRYLSLKDKYEMVVHTGTQPIAGSGVCSGFDPVNNLFVGMPCCYSPIISKLNTQTLAWTPGQNKVYPAGSTYTYADYVDSLGMLVVVDQNLLRGYNAASNVWTVIDSLPEATTGRPSIAYDCDRNVCLMTGVTGKTYIYKVKTGEWENVPLDTAMPNLGEHVAYDKRHKAFIGGAKGGTAMWAFRFDAATTAEEYGTISAKTFGIISTTPNPFRTSLTASCYLSEPGRMKLEVYTVFGALVSTLFSGTARSGLHNLRWNGKNSNGKDVAGGVYMLKLVSGGKQMIRPVMLSR
ncbi:MAG: hypothetical protein JNL74_09895 [Fibrobacteres bacterium]|nr:hypothetical protein [Fibrobacterota bacterium]